MLGLADSKGYVGFDSDEIIRKGFDPTKAKRIGELAENNEKSISEAILAHEMRFYKKCSLLSQIDTQVK